MSRVKQGLLGILAWTEDRIGYRGIWDRLTAGTVEKHGAWLRTTGMACLALVLVECVTGPVLGIYYTPAPNAAYRSIDAIEQNPMGRFVRGLHHWSSATLILLGLLTIARMFFMAAYKEGEKRRRDVVWIGALIFFQLIMLFQLTGHILPWDTNAVKTADVEAGIGGNVWVVGPLVKRFLLGGGSTGAATLSRWHGFHTQLLPLVLVALVGIPLIAHRLRGDGSGEPAVDQNTEDEAADSNATTNRSGREHYYPFHLAREMVVALAIFAVVAGLAMVARTPLEKEATAANLDGYIAVSEWYVLPLHAMTLIPPFNHVAFEPVATVVLPGLLFTALALLPFVDRNPARSLRGRPVAAAAGAVTILSVAGLALFSVITERPTEPHQTADSHSTQSSTGTAAIEKGKALFKAQSCDGCHAIGGKGGAVGPSLTKAGSLHPDRQWQIDHLIKPASKVPGSTMPAYAQLKKDELEALADYMTSLK